MVQGMFIGRQSELKKLNERYDSGQFECAVIYGRRRVGKTTLINEFVKDKATIFFTGLETSSRENLENLSRSIMSLRYGFDTTSPVFPSFQAALDSVYEMAKEKRIIMVIDEYPYLAASYRGISSLLQIQIDEKYKNSKLMLILCGSSMSFMENQVLGYKSPLYGRRTAQFKIQPFDYFEAKDYYRGFGPYELASIYGITGGVPQYLALMNDKLSLEDNIKKNFFDSSAYLFEEPANLLKQEVREPAHYNAIIRAIATGSSKNSEISSKVGLESSACTAYLKNLISLGIVRKETPLTEGSSKKTIYVIDDNMFRFWYRFVPDNAALIQNGMTDRVWQKVEPQISAFMGKVFEDICKQWLWRENASGRLPIDFVDLGRWWGNDPIRRRETEIDILAYADEDHAIFGECKWTNEKVDTRVLDTLVERSELFRYRHKHLYLFAKTGFSSECIEKARTMNGVELVAFQDM
jgi:AAA+ ATPase superfamily predicted ATPase